MIDLNLMSPQIAPMTGPKIGILATTLKPAFSESLACAGWEKISQK